MSKVYMSLLSILILAITAISIVTLKFYKDKNTERTLAQKNIPTKLKDVGTVDSISILPLIDYYSADENLQTESGVSYLLETGGKRILFDVGFNRENKHPSPLLHNMKALNIDTDDIDYIFISHLHPDHVGGLKAKRNNTFSLSGKEPTLNGIKAYTPTAMNHRSAEIEVISNPVRLSDGIVSLGPINRAIWGMGLTAEQAIAVNVKDRGIVLIVGCGHQTIEKVVEQAAQLFDEPIYAIIGGLHFPVTKRQGDWVFNIRRYLGTGNLPWQAVQKSVVDNTIDFLKNKKIRLIGISAHDSCDWTLKRFKESFAENYLDIMVGKVISIE